MVDVIILPVWIDCTTTTNNNNSHQWKCEKSSRKRRLQHPPLNGNVHHRSRSMYRSTRLFILNSGRCLFLLLLWTTTLATVAVGDIRGKHPHLHSILLYYCPCLGYPRSEILQKRSPRLSAFGVHRSKRRRNPFPHVNSDRLLSKSNIVGAISLQLVIHSLLPTYNPRNNIVLYDASSTLDDESNIDLMTFNVFGNAVDATTAGNTSFTTTNQGALSSGSFATKSKEGTATEATTTIPSQQLELFQTIILQQQRQIDTLLQVLQQQQLHASASVNSVTETTAVINGALDSVDNMAPLLFQPLSSHSTSIKNNNNANYLRTRAASMIPSNQSIVTKALGTIEQRAPPQQKNQMGTPNTLKAMLFIDGTWLYYSIHERLSKDCSIIQKYGRGWQHRYDIDWAKLPALLCTTIQNEIMNQIETATTATAVESSKTLEPTRPSPPMVKVDLVRSSVYTSYKADTPTTSYRYKLFQELQKANYHVHMMETVGKSEKCVDIQLAVEILHYATMENSSNSYDIALLLTGDKDLMPAIIRTRCKGKLFGLVSMRPGCNRALVDTPGLLDFDVIWMEDFLDQLVIPRVLDDTDILDTTDMNAGTIPRAPTSMYTLHKVVYDFILYSGLPRVSSRDLGRYLKQLSTSGNGGITLLETMKRYYGGMYQYLSSMGCYSFELPSFTHSTTDHSYWISLSKAAGNDADPDEEGGGAIAEDDFRINEPSRLDRLSEPEKHFFSTYSVDRLVQDQQNLYMHSIERMSDIVPKHIEEIPDVVLKNDSDVSGLINGEQFSISSLRRIIDDFIKQSGWYRVMSADLENYLHHLVVSSTATVLDEVNQLCGNVYQFLLSSPDYYNVESTINSDDLTGNSYWISRNSDKNTNDAQVVSRWNEAERKFFTRYTVEPLLINRRRWYYQSFESMTNEDSNRAEHLLKHSSPYPDYREMTLVELKAACREMGLAVSGKKSALLERIESSIEQEQISRLQSRHDNEQINKASSQLQISEEEETVVVYLKELILEYLQAKGGAANSRMIGRYLAANKASSYNRNHMVNNALKEMKSKFGNLNTFVAAFPDTFISFRDNNRIYGNSVDGSNSSSDAYGFSIALKRKHSDR